MSAESASAVERMAIQIASESADVGREWGRLHVAKFDVEQTEWVSRRLGGDAPGMRGFAQPTGLDFARFRIRPYEEVVSGCNLITTAGWQRALNLIFGIQSTGAFGSATCRIGVGTGTTSAAVGNTDLAAATGPTGRFFQLATGNASLTTGTATQRATVGATFGTGDANFAWQEWCIDQGTAGSGTGAATAVMLNRAVSSQGTKTSGQTWSVSAALDFS